MVEFRPSHLGEIAWHQPSAFTNHYELRSGDSLLAEVRFLKALGTLAEAAIAGRAWTFKRTGFLTPVVTARLQGIDDNIATFEPNWSMTKGRLTLPGHSSFEFKSTSFWGSEWTLFDSGGSPLMVYRPEGMFHQGAKVELTPAVLTRDDLPLLLTFSWYVLVLAIRDMAAVSAAV